MKLKPATATALWKSVVLGGAALLFGTVSNSSAQQCALSGKSIEYSHAPRGCNQQTCLHFQKLTFVRDKILAYFKKNIASSAEDVALGFEYTVGRQIDVLRDPLQRPGLTHAINQLPPGARYSRYVISAEWRGNNLYLHETVEYVLPPVGTFMFSIKKNVAVQNCNTCSLAEVSITYFLNDVMQPPITVGSRSCRIE